jgi:hypothetical protein
LINNFALFSNRDQYNFLENYFKSYLIPFIKLLDAYVLNNYPYIKNIMDSEFNYIGVDNNILSISELPIEISNFLTYIDYVRFDIIISGRRFRVSSIFETVKAYMFYHYRDTSVVFSPINSCIFVDASEFKSEDKDPIHLRDKDTSD